MSKGSGPRIAVVFNRDSEGAEADFENCARDDVIQVARSVGALLRDEGYNVLLAGVREDVHRDLLPVYDHQPAAVFNLCESLLGDNRFEALVPMLLEFRGLAFTGSPPAALLWALHKDRAKHLLVGSGVSTPEGFAVEQLSELDRHAGCSLPAIVKPSREDASVGITRESVVSDWSSLRARAGFVLERYRQPALVERYVEGREINVSILARLDGSLEVLPFREIDFSAMPEGRPRIVSFEGKWVEGSVDYRGAASIPCQLSSALGVRLETLALDAFRALGLRDYGRIDIRLAADGEPFVIDVNPNCDFSDTYSGFACAARAAGIDYRALVLRLVALALNRRPDADTIPLAVRSQLGGGDPRLERERSPAQSVSSRGGRVRS
ncbi:MAG: hypothetical protein R3A51_15745 [Nannocystaceae bacterium]